MARCSVHAVSHTTLRLPIIIDSLRDSQMGYKATINLPPTHPGEILGDDLKALGFSASRFAAHLGVPTNAISEIVAGRQSISPRMALFIGKAFGTGPEIWLNLQRAYDLRVAHEKFAQEVEAIRELEATAA